MVMEIEEKEENLIDSSTSSVTTKKIDGVLFKDWDVALLPRVLVTTDKDSGTILPEVKKGRVEVGPRKEKVLEGDVEEGIV